MTERNLAAMMVLFRIEPQELDQFQYNDDNMPLNMTTAHSIRAKEKEIFYTEDKMATERCVPERMRYEKPAGEEGSIHK